MKKKIAGFTIMETLIGIILLGLILAGVFSGFIFIQQFFKDGIALANSQATARIVIEKMVRPIRHGRSFTVSGDGNTFTLTRYDSSSNSYITDVYTFEGDTFKKNGGIIGVNIVKIPDLNIFEEIKPNEVVKINFGVKNEGTYGNYKEVHISTEMALRN